MTRLLAIVEWTEWPNVVYVFKDMPKPLGALTPLNHFQIPFMTVPGIK